jgi:hypothetical protein
VARAEGARLSGPVVSVVSCFSKGPLAELEGHLTSFAFDVNELVALPNDQERQLPGVVTLSTVRQFGSDPGDEIDVTDNTTIPIVAKIVKSGNRQDYQIATEFKLGSNAVTASVETLHGTATGAKMIKLSHIASTFKSNCVVRPAGAARAN